MHLLTMVRAMTELPSFLERGEVARLIPVVKDSHQEDRATSILLAGMMAVDDFARCLLNEIGQRLRVRSQVRCYTQIVFKKLPGEVKHRPDGLIEVVTGPRTWRAVVESKIGRAILTEEQIRDYVQAAKLNDIDAVITLSNEFATLPTHHPIKFSHALPKGINLFHWSWMHIRTQAKLLLHDDEFTSDDQRYVLEEVLRYFEHPSVGVSGFVQMNPEWKDLVLKVQTGARPSKRSEEITSTVAAWHQEIRDLCLSMSRTLAESQPLKQNVRPKLSRAHARDPSQRLKDDCGNFTKIYQLQTALDIPDAAALVAVIADLRTRTIMCSMTLDAPKDKKGATARTTWLLRQLRESKAPDIIVKALWPGKSAPTQSRLEDLRDNPKLLEDGKEGLRQHSFQILVVRDLAGKFSGRRTFIEALETIVPEFYEQVGQHLRAWVPRPPKIEAREMPTEMTATPKPQPVIRGEVRTQPPESTDDSSTPVKTAFETLTPRSEQTQADSHNPDSGLTPSRDE